MEWREVERKDREKQEREMEERLREARYNKVYREVRVEGIPIYLKKGWKEERWRVGNELKEARYWEEEKKGSVGSAGEKRKRGSTFWKVAVERRKEAGEDRKR